MGRNIQEKMCLTLLIINDVKVKLGGTFVTSQMAQKEEFGQDTGWQGCEPPRKRGSLINARESENWYKYVPKT